MTIDVQKQAQLVTNGLYLGPLQIAQDETTLADLGITTVVSVLGSDQEYEKVAVTEENKVQKVYATCFLCGRSGAPNIDHSMLQVWIQVADRVDAEEEMAIALPGAIDALEKWDTEDGSTLVHCQSGISRSATVTIAFLMKCRGMKLMEAYGAVFTARPCINPNDGFFRVLQNYAESLGQPADDGSRAANRLEYDAYQLTSQLAFAAVTMDSARVALKEAEGKIESAASMLLEKAGM